MLNLDTHILLDAVTGELSRAERSLLTRVPRWGVSAIVLWEIEMLHRLGRLQHGLDHTPLADLLEALEVWPLDMEVCRCLRRLDFRSDPADEIIAATSLARRVPLVTRDARLRQSKVVRCL